MPIQYYKGKPPTLQFKILDLLIEKERVSRPMIIKTAKEKNEKQKDQGKEQTENENYADIHSAIKSLIDYGIIQKYNRKIKKEKKTGIQETFYIFTDKGIKTMIDEKLSINDFWKLVFFYFDKDNKVKTSISFETILNQFTNVLKIDKDMIFFLENSVFSWWYDELKSGEPEDCKSFLEHHKNIFSKIYWNRLTRFIPEERLSSILSNTFASFMKQHEDEIYDFQTVRFSNDLKALESNNRKNHTNLFSIGYNEIKKLQSQNKNNRKITSVFNKEFSILLALEKNRDELELDVYTIIEKPYAEYFSFLFYADLKKSFPNYEWNKFFERTNLTEWFGVWRDRILKIEHESIKEIEKLLTV